MHRILWTALYATLLALPASAASPACDRTCLSGHLTRYLPNENLLGQAFKFRGGRILRVQGVFLNANVYRAGTGWE